MTREEFVKQRCEIDKITEEEFEKTYRVVDCNCGAYYCKGYRCLDLDGLLKEIEQLQQENKQLKENYERIYNENCILREKHNISDIDLLDENYRLKQVIDKAIEFTNKNWGTWCTHHLEYMTELQNILKEVSE